MDKRDLVDRTNATSFGAGMKFLHACIFFVTPPLFACLWDRDTIAMEAQGRLEVVETMVGWFDRFPAEYYQMRLDRVTRELSDKPERLDLYDDAAVSCDRLGHPDEAVAWMEKKQAAMLPLPQEKTQDHRYRLHANLGVFRTHQWIKSAERDRHVEKLDLAIQEVRAALEINPNAHFGRERAHLALLEWWREGLAIHATDGSSSGPHELADYFTHYPESFTTNGAANLMKGFCGLIQMGSAQDSLDAHAVVAWHLMHDKTKKGASDTHHTLAFLACQRLAELIVEGREPVYAGADFKRWLRPETYFDKHAEAMTKPEKTDRIASGLLRGLFELEGSSQLQPIPPWFHQTRATAQQRLMAKNEFMQKRFAVGMHPDTHADFWQGWEELAMPRVPHTTKEQILGVSLAHRYGTAKIVGNGLALLGILCVVGIYVFLLLRRRRRAKSY